VARLDQLVEGVQDETLRRAIEREIAALKERTRFGLVYERHIPETALIADPDLVQTGALVRPKQDVDKETTYRVVGFKGKTKARLAPDANGQELTAPIKDLFVLKPFGEPVYPSLTLVDSVERSQARPYHAVINGENFHALQLLAYVYERQVDCVYLDPPYNSGARDWKYNNRYVDNTDSYRHSKWLSMMEKRLRIAKRLLKPDGVVIITIDENEVHHLGVLLEDIFPEYLRYMMTIVINPKGTAKVNFSRVEEYALFIVPNTGSDVIEQLRPRAEQTNMMPAKDQLELDDNEEAVVAEDEDDVASEVHAEDDTEYSVLYLRRRGAESSYRESRWRQFYAIYVDEKTKQPLGWGR
jgi:adenine-specific DNA-methyltransferase